MDRTPSEVGERAELAVAAALRLAGKRVYLPFFAADSRVDLVFEDEDGFHRAQVKSSRVRGDVIWFRACSFTNKVHRDYRGEVDVIAIYSPELDQVFLIPVDQAPARGGHLRLKPARNNQATGVRWARDYLLNATPEGS
ncbi:MAG: hypothetical protein JO086_05725 [Acidimicrobiia bacterium]|nr:hypothetical protein [Acidimicrobiia bacterium]